MVAAAAKNPLRADPSRTGLLRRRFSTAIEYRFKQVKLALWDLVYKQDALRLTHNVSFGFNTSVEKLASFQEWLKGQMDQKILDKLKDTEKELWWEEFIRLSYEQGAGRAWDDTHKGKYKGGHDWYKGGKQQFLKDAFKKPASVESVKLLAARTFTDLKGITEAMSQQLSSILVDGMIQGKGPKEVADEIAAKVDGITKQRALTLARTEVIRAHSEGALDMFENLGVTQIGVAVEWSTAEDFKVCPKCRPLQGIILTVDEARGMFPRHPNCRCSPIPYLGGDDGVKKTYTRIKKAIEQSLAHGAPKKGKGKGKKKVIQWAGAHKKISKKRPETLL